ncbi:AAA family ATPase [Microbacterium chengjingii]|uniref:AAA family ATPase n=1 Tax=Paramicrobacterium chengjingii TaxID=2769067 RepID=UPI001AB060C5
MSEKAVSDDNSSLELAPNPTQPQQISMGDPTVEMGNVADDEWQRWRNDLAEIGGESPLLHFDDEREYRIELGAAHPGSLPQFITGNSTLLSNLIRDDVALRSARVAADLITTKGIELRTVRGLEAVHLSVGLAHWRHGGMNFCAPVLLRPVAIRRYGNDYELKLTGSITLNPELARALEDQFDIHLDARAFEALAMSEGVFKPQPVIDSLRGLTSHLDWFNVQPRLVVSSFCAVGAAMQRDADELDHPMLDALAGNASARRLLESGTSLVDAVGSDERSPSTDTLLLDSDAEQENVIAQITEGQSVVVSTLPGTGGTQTIVNALGALVSSHKRVLVVSPRKSTLDGIRHRLNGVGLHGLAAHPRTLRRDVIQAISRNEKASSPKVSDIDDALVRLRKVLLDYRSGLAHKDPALGVTVSDMLSALTALSNLPKPPSTTARLSYASLATLSAGRSDVAESLAQAAALGEFQYGPDDSPWYGANFSTTPEAKQAHELAKRINNTDLPRLLERAYELIGQTRMRPFECIDELGVYLRLMLDIRETLDKFLPAVFDRSLADLIAATGSRRDAASMSSGNRRRLKKLAREYVRPGVHIADMNASLRRIQQQRILLQRYVDAGISPEVPLGIADVHVAHQKVVADLAQLDVPLGRTDQNSRLAALPIRSLVRVMSGLAAESTVMENLQERTTLITELREAGLTPLLTDLSNRHVPAERVTDELELAWWQSALEHTLATDKSLLGANTQVIDRLESDFRLVDEAHASASGQLLAGMLAETWRIGLVDWPEEARDLRSLLTSVPRVTPPELESVAPHLSRALSPVWLVSPYEVPQIPDSIRFDAVFLVDAGASTIAENVGAIRRAKQVVAFGDTVTQSPTPFHTAVSDAATDAALAEDVESRHADSALARLSELLPGLTLTRSYRAGGEDLAELVNQRFYGGEIDSLPWAGSFLGHGSLTLDYVSNGHGMPDPETGTVESVDPEVVRVVNLVLEHATNRPRESLMVITASQRHATRVQQSVLAAFARRADLAEFILRERAEPFTVLTLEQSVAESRDRVIFSLGYGVTPHGRVLSTFGTLGEPGGDRLLAVGMTRARRSMVIVTCIRPEDIDPERMQHGIAALAQLLREPPRWAPRPPVVDGAEPMMLDLAERLYRNGLSVEIGYRGKLALVASYRDRAIVVESDVEVAGESLRESLRLRPEVLRRLGWHYLRVHGFDLFSDPVAVASKVMSIVGAPETEPADPGNERAAELIDTAPQPTRDA